MTVAAEEVRGMTMVHNGELFDYHADDAEDVQRFGTIQWNENFKIFYIFTEKAQPSSVFRPAWKGLISTAWIGQKRDAYFLSHRTVSLPTSNTPVTSQDKTRSQKNGDCSAKPMAVAHPP